MKKLCLLFVALASASCAGRTPPPRFSEVGPADLDAPEAPPPPPLTLPRAEPSPRPAPTATPHVHGGHHR
jgi:hypothetical protein